MLDVFSIGEHECHAHTVDERNPAPLGMYKTHVNNGISTISTGAGFFP